jgi:hypothetical protein
VGRIWTWQSRKIAPWTPDVQLHASLRREGRSAEAQGARASPQQIEHSICAGRFTFLSMTTASSSQIRFRELNPSFYFERG